MMAFIILRYTKGPSWDIKPEKDGSLSGKERQWLQIEK